MQIEEGDTWLHDTMKSGCSGRHGLNFSHDQVESFSVLMAGLVIRLASFHGVRFFCCATAGSAGCYASGAHFFYKEFCEPGKE